MANCASRDLSVAVTRVRCLVIGSGAAGLWAALHAANDGTVLVITKDRVTESSTNYAQGGIATSACPEDSPDLHAQDTLAAGAGLCDEPAVAILTHEGPQRVMELVSYGAQFDQVNGQWLCRREAAHTRSRIIHAMGDATGAEVQRALTEAVRNHPEVTVREFTQALRLVLVNGEVIGADTICTATGERIRIVADATILATGGVGALYKVTTNPLVANGDGMAIALRAGATLEDMEFVQFHPTALACDETPAPLLTEALRGEGAILLNTHGERFLDRYHPMAELAPRDVVSRAEFLEMERLGAEWCLLDLRPIPEEQIRANFPHVLQMLTDRGFNPFESPVPVRPAAHFVMGGIATDLDGWTGLRRLYAAGECACTGVHGANRLASNSLLEGLVFGYRAARAARREALLPLDAVEAAGSMEPPAVPALPSDVADQVRELMWKRVGIVRNSDGLSAVVDELAHLWQRTEWSPWPAAQEAEAANMVEVASVITRAALAREESRGAQYRTDFPETKDEWHCHLRIRKAPDGSLEFSRRPVARR
ncbi:MAG: L-aspartate oxidase [Armatimonadetes bacterium]|nr:L-aspartate oxidase [Armatimonadota bacterium]